LAGADLLEAGEPLAFEPGEPVVLEFVPGFVDEGALLQRPSILITGASGGTMGETGGVTLSFAVGFAFTLLCAFAQRQVHTTDVNRRKLRHHRIEKTTSAREHKC
jgi:hypothetical protein